VLVDKDHEKVLEFLAERTGPEAVYGFAPMCKETGLDRKRVRVICRLFKRKGWAEFYSGLISEDGDFGGSGYCIAPAGMAAYQALPGGENRLLANQSK
jgi:hypothetical protein